LYFHVKQPNEDTRHQIDKWFAGEEFKRDTTRRARVQKRYHKKLGIWF
jgi:hypothetical protein